MCILSVRSGSCVCARVVNQYGVIRQPLAAVCPASVDLKPDGYRQQTRGSIAQTEETENRSRIMFQRCHMQEKIQEFLIGPLSLDVKQAVCYIFCNKHIGGDVSDVNYVPRVPLGRMPVSCLYFLSCQNTTVRPHRVLDMVVETLYRPYKWFC